jgi:hypothetical protein
VAIEINAGFGAARFRDTARRILSAGRARPPAGKCHGKSPVQRTSSGRACHAGILGYDDGVSEVTGSPTPTALAPQKASFGAALGNGLAAATGALVRGTSLIFGHVASRSGSALADFRARPEHSRWRAYALLSYGLIVAATLTGQLYTDNVLSAYVRVQRVDLPAMTQIFVRNDSSKSWHDVKIVLNGIYQYRTEQVVPGGHVMLPVNKFAIRDQLGKATFAPRGIAPRTLLVDTAAGRYEAEFRE